MQNFVKGRSSKLVIGDTGIWRTEYSCCVCIVIRSNTAIGVVNDGLNAVTGIDRCDLSTVGVDCNMDWMRETDLLLTYCSN